MAAGEMEPQLGDLITYGIDSVMGPTSAERAAEAEAMEAARIAEIDRVNRNIIIPYTIFFIDTLSFLVLQQL